MSYIEFRTLTLIDTSFGQFNVFTFVGKEDGLRKSLRNCSSYERVLELLEEQLLEEPKKIDDIVSLFSNSNSEIYMVLENQKFQY